MGTGTEFATTDCRFRVAVIFEKGRVRPVWFEINGTRIWIQEICYIWEHREGAASIINFAVWDGNEKYELQYNKRSLAWYLRLEESTVK